ncbi:hypothetical protein KC968_00420 [Candidatus Saccharibacteria bacterium]|nr:hypothetical protein [Candidatus Saccharibacteria bacterium]
MIFFVVSENSRKVSTSLSKVISKVNGLSNFRFAVNCWSCAKLMTNSVCSRWWIISGTDIA